MAPSSAIFPATRAAPGMAPVRVGAGTRAGVVPA